MSEAVLHTPDGNDEQPFLPVRRLHNYVYCPRLCYLQWVENLFVENADTAAGEAAHRNVDNPSTFNDEKKEAYNKELNEGMRLRSVHLTSESLRLTGVVDLIEGEEDGVRVVDYKRGSALRTETGDRIAKDYDAVQIAAYAMLLEESGTSVTAASIYYAGDRRHVTVDLTDELFVRTRRAIVDARTIGGAGHLPPPLLNDIRCHYCSAYPICLPNESAAWAAWKETIRQRDRQLTFPFGKDRSANDFDEQDETVLPPRPERDDGEILVVQTYGTQVGQRGGEFVVSQKRIVLRKMAIHQIRAMYLYGAVQLTAQAAQTCLAESIDLAYFSAAGRFLGALRGLPTSGIDARLGQFEIFQKEFCRTRLAGESIRAKIRNQRVMLMRNGDPEKHVLKRLSIAAENAANATSIDEIRGIEGAAASAYFAEFASMLKTGGKLEFEFTKRTRRPPRDPVNALLSLGYSVLV